jgi:methyl-accepting chemotaxis protein
MSFYRDASIERKLTFVMLTTSLLGLSVACVGFEIYERSSYREAIGSELTALADTLGANTTASLAFNDRQSAMDILKALSAEKHIVSACLYDKHGKFFAAYDRVVGDDECSPLSPGASGAEFETESVTLSRLVSLGGEMAGSIVITSDLGVLHAKIRQYTEISAIVIFLSLFATFLVSSRLIRLITGPILQLAKIAGRVSAKEDYALRAVATAQDEVGTLVNAFNKMLERIQERDTALQQSNNQLESRVQERTRQLQDEVDDRILAEEKLSEERGMLRALIDNVPDFMYVKDTKSRFVIANASLASSIGAASSADLIQKTDFDFYPKPLATAFFDDDQQVIRSDKRCSIAKKNLRICRAIRLGC